MAKRGQNTGSITKRKDGRWEARLTLPDGRRRSFYGRTRAEAEKKMDDARRDLEAGILADPGRMTVADLGREWIATIEASDLAYTSKGNLRNRWEVHVEPVIGSVPLRNVTGAHIQRVLAEVKRKGRSDGTIRVVRQVMSNAFRHAVAWNLIPRNPVSGIPAPAARHRELPLDRPEQIDILVDVISNDRYQVAYMLALGLGLRSAEVRGLRWRDIDFDAGLVQVRHNIAVRKGEVTFLPLKTAHARRTLPLPQFLSLLLRTHRREQNETRLRQGPKWHDYDLVVTGLVPGRPLSGEVLSRRLALLCEQAGLPRLTFHHLRHLCATMLTMRGVPPRVVQGILGHSTPDLAMRVYSHVQASALASAAEAMDEALRRSGS